MKISSVLRIIFGSLLFLAGILLELSLSAAVAWGSSRLDFTPLKVDPSL
jgi:hypothetical protein